MIPWLRLNHFDLAFGNWNSGLTEGLAQMDVARSLSRCDSEAMVKQGLPFEAGYFFGSRFRTGRTNRVHKMKHIPGRHAVPLTKLLLD